MSEADAIAFMARLHSRISDGPRTRLTADSFEPLDARYVRVRAAGLGMGPDWHPGAGAKSWIFVDEIIAE